MNVPNDWRWASDKQYQAAIHPEDRPLLLVGGQGSGKTLVLCRKIIKYLLDYPGARVLIVRRVFRQLGRTVAKTFFSELHPSLIEKRSDTGGSCTLKNGSEVIFLHLEQEASVSALLSLEINGVFLNECVEIDQKHVDMVLRRLGRWTQAQVPNAGPDWKWRTPEGKPIPPPMFLADSNPDDGDDEHWMVKRFYEESPARHAKTIPEVGADGLPTGVMLSYKDLGYDLIEMPSYENRYLPLENLQQLYATGEVERFVEGKRGTRRGRIHIVHPDSLVQGTDDLLMMVRTRCRLSRVMDHGTTAPTCCTWWGADADGNLYCVDPDTKVLTADLRWVPAGGVGVGDKLAGFDEYPGDSGRRRWSKGTVEAVERINQPCYRVSLSDGTVLISSEKHLWLVKRTSMSEWRTTERLRIGQRLVKACDVWDADTSWTGGYLAGAFDGEGHLTLNQHGTQVLGLAQNDNQLLARVRSALDARSIRYGVYDNESGVQSLMVTRKRDILRLLGSVRPERLLPKFDFNDFGGFRGYECPRVVGIQKVGWQPVVSMRISCKTFIAEGFASHNCYREYYQPDKLISYHRDAIFEYSRGEQYVENLADPSIFAKTMRRNNENRCTWSVADEYMDRGMYKPATAIAWTRAENTELGTRNRINEYLRFDEQHTNPFTGKRGSPRLFFFVANPFYPLGCVHTHRETELQRHVQLPDETFSTDRDEEVVDHAYDTLRYYVAARVPVKFAKPGFPRGSIGWDLMQNERRQREADRAEVGYGL